MNNLFYIGSILFLGFFIFCFIFTFFFLIKEIIQSSLIYNVWCKAKMQKRIEKFKQNFDDAYLYYNPDVIKRDIEHLYQRLKQVENKLKIDYDENQEIM